MAQPGPAVSWAVSPGDGVRLPAGDPVTGPRPAAGKCDG